ncbi:expressed unknown protein (Partial), partial [Seminavis robusta]
RWTRPASLDDSGKLMAIGVAGDVIRFILM